MLNIYRTDQELSIRTQKFQNVLAFGKSRKEWEVVGLDRFLDYCICWDYWCYLPGNPPTNILKVDILTEDE